MKKRIIIVTSFALILVLALMISLKPNRNLTKIEVALKDALIPINKMFVKTFINSPTDQTESYLIQKNINIALEKEIKELKKMLELNKTHTEFSKINATVISRNNISWLNTLTIDKGTNAGIKEGMAVITKDGLIGKISKVTKSSSEVKLLTSTDSNNKTSVLLKVNDQNYYAILNSYDEKTNLLIVTAIDKNVNVKETDVVLTSGLGSMPQGLYIGQVIKIELDKYSLSKKIYVKSEVDFSTLNYVTVLKENN